MPFNFVTRQLRHSEIEIFQILTDVISTAKAQPSGWRITNDELKKVSYSWNIIQIEYMIELNFTFMSFANLYFRRWVNRELNWNSHFICLK